MMHLHFYWRKNSGNITNVDQSHHSATETPTEKRRRIDTDVLQNLFLILFIALITKD